ncbi:MAG: hypothetical protein ABR591_00030 [Candidatus Velthaea sp.]
MRRLPLTLIAAGAAVLLSACGQGGSAFNFGNNTKVDRVVIQSNGQPEGVFKVVPGGSILLSAQGTRGANNVVINADVNYTFNAAVAPAGRPFQNGVSGAQGICAGFTQVPPPVGGVAQAAIPLIPTVPAAALSGSSQSPNTITLTAPTIASLNAQFAPGNTAGPAPASYCIIVNATHVSDGVVGSATVDVTVNT